MGTNSLRSGAKAVVAAAIVIALAVLMIPRTATARSLAHNGAIAMRAARPHGRRIDAAASTVHARALFRDSFYVALSNAPAGAFHSVRLRSNCNPRSPPARP